MLVLLHVLLDSLKMVMIVNSILKHVLQDNISMLLETHAIHVHQHVKHAQEISTNVLVVMMDSFLM